MRMFNRLRRFVDSLFLGPDFRHAYNIADEYSLVHLGVAGVTYTWCGRSKWGRRYANDLNQADIVVTCRVCITNRDRGGPVPVWDAPRPPGIPYGVYRTRRSAQPQPPEKDENGLVDRGNGPGED